MFLGHMRVTEASKCDMGTRGLKGLHLFVVIAACLFTVSPQTVNLQERISAPAVEFAQTRKGKLAYNAKACAACHSVPGIGGSSKTTVRRTGRYSSGRYVGDGFEGIEHLEGESTSRHPNEIFSLRVALNLLGDGYVEAVPDSELRATGAIEKSESNGSIHGELLGVTLAEESRGDKVAGRFGWKDQHGSLASAAAEALRNELGVPNKYFPGPRTSAHLGPVSTSDDVSGEIDTIRALVEFIRSTEPIAPDPERSALPEVKAGSALFDKIGCSICHVRTMKTAPPGTKMLDGTLTVSERLGNREIHPFSDFLLHDVGTGDGIIQNIVPGDYDQTTANKFRTPPLWGVRYRSWMMHDGKAITYHQAIMRHGGEAKGVVEAYERLTPKEQEELREFLNSL